MALVKLSINLPNNVAQVQHVPAVKVGEPVTPKALDSRANSGKVPLGRQIAEFFKHTPSPAELAARQKNQAFKEEVGRALLGVEVRAVWDGKTELERPGGSPTPTPTLEFGALRSDVLERHGFDLLPLALGGKPLPADWVAKQQEAQRPYKERQPGSSWSATAKLPGSGRIAAVYVEDLAKMYAEVLQAKPQVAQRVYLERGQQKREIEKRVMDTPVKVQIRDLGVTWPAAEMSSIKTLLEIIDMEGHMGLKSLADVARIDPKAPWLTIKMGDAFDREAIWLAIKFNEIDIDSASRGGKSYTATKQNPMDPELLKSEIKVKIKDVGETREDTMTVAQALQMLGVKHYNEIRDIPYTKPWKTVTVDEVFDLDAVKKAIKEVESSVRAEIASSKAQAAGE